MDRRIALHNVLKTVVDNVYFQPPESIQLKYPCIIYNRSNEYAPRANNGRYFGVQGYSILLIERDPDSEVFKDILTKLRMSSLGSFFVKDNLHHTSISVYF